MGWKSTIDVNREEVIKEISLAMVSISHKSNSELEQMLYDLNFGDDASLKWFGYNFNVIG